MNLASALPPGVEQAQRVVEIVDADAARRQAGRQRFKQYRALGVEPVTHQPAAARGLNGQELLAGRHRAALVCALGVARRLCSARRGPGRLLHHDPAAERHRHAPHGARVPGHDHGRADALSPHARRVDAVAAGHRSCRHRHADGRRAAAQRRGQAAHRPQPRAVRRAGVGVEAAVRRQHRRAAAPARRLGRLVARPLHDGSRAVARGHGSVRAAARGRPHLPGPAPRQLGSGAAHGAVRPRGAERGGDRLALVPALSVERRQRRAHRRDHASRDHDRRRRRRRAPGR